MNVAWPFWQNCIYIYIYIYIYIIYKHIYIYIYVCIYIPSPPPLLIHFQEKALSKKPSSRNGSIRSDLTLLSSNGPVQRLLAALTIYTFILRRMGIEWVFYKWHTDWCATLHTATSQSVQWNSHLKHSKCNTWPDERKITSFHWHICFRIPRLVFYWRGFGANHSLLSEGVMCWLLGSALLFLHDLPAEYLFPEHGTHRYKQGRQNNHLSYNWHHIHLSMLAGM